MLKEEEMSMTSFPNLMDGRLQHNQNHDENNNQNNVKASEGLSYRFVNQKNKNQEELYENCQSYEPMW